MAIGILVVCLTVPQPASRLFLLFDTSIIIWTNSHSMQRVCLFGNHDFSAGLFDH